jgi:sugar phosphate isomerase/epimerase
MGEILYTGFKGKNNSSYQLVQKLNGEKIFLTNSFQGLKKDIEGIADIGVYRIVYMFGLDKNLYGSVRIEACAKQNIQTARSYIDLFPIKQKMEDYHIKSEISEHPTRFLCNEAYYQILQKTCGKAVFIHIPTQRYLPESMFYRLAELFNNGGL